MDCKSCKNNYDCKSREAYERMFELANGNAECSGYEPNTVDYCADDLTTALEDNARLAKDLEATGAEIDRLKHIYDLAVAEREANVKVFTEQLKTAKAEAVKEFAERLKRRLSLNVRISNEDYADIVDDIENLAKELTEGKNNDK